ncbi:hypothetical protein V6W11_01320 [Micromonospora profundi]|uniref:hypothetical protein n=1 Tax=Micromonospora profundi TaxID=1420889 RepID=UPI002FF42BF6
MPLPLSKNKLNQLGKRLAQAGHPSPDDLRTLHSVIRYYQSVLDDVKAQLDGLGFGESISRVKTQSTLIEKLQREQDMALARVQDFAGARIVIDGGRRQQDQIVAQICEHFSRSTDAKTPRVIDRRAKPSYGYRAVHVIVQPDDVPVEIQVRTPLQNSWAQTVEGLADRWGRGIRYGQAPDEPNRVVRNTGLGRSYTRREVVTQIRKLAESINMVEQRAEVAEVAKSTLDCFDRQDFDGLKRAFEAYREHLPVKLPLPPSPQLPADYTEDNLVIVYSGFRKYMKRTLHALVPDRRARGRIFRRRIPHLTIVTHEQFIKAIAYSMAVSIITIKNFDTMYSRHSASVRSSMETLERAVEQGGLE